VEISYNKLINNPETIQIKSIAAEGFEIIKIDPNLPVEVKDGEKVVISLELKVPQEGHKGNIKLIIGRMNENYCLGFNFNCIRGFLLDIV